MSLRRNFNLLLVYGVVIPWILEGTAKAAKIVLYIGSIKTDEVCPSLISASKTHLNVTVLGLMSKAFSVEEIVDFPIRKSIMLRKHMRMMSGKHFRNDDIILFNCGDVLYTPNIAQYIDAAYSRFDRGTILFPSTVINGTNFVSTDTFISTFGAIMIFLNAWIEFLKDKSYVSAFKSVNEMPLGDLDAILRQKSASSMQDLKLVADENNKIFQTTIGTSLETISGWTADKVDINSEVFIENGAINNPLTKSNPLILLFNGDKVEMKSVEAHLAVKTTISPLDNAISSILEKHPDLQICSQSKVDVRRAKDQFSPSPLSIDTTLRQNGGTHSSSTGVWPSVYPKSVEMYAIRKDKYTGKNVLGGRIELLGGEPEENEYVKDQAIDPKVQQVSLETFQRLLQCAEDEPDLDGARGSISLLRMIPPTKENLELMCAWAETDCNPWYKCSERSKVYKNDSSNLPSDIEFPMNKLGPPWRLTLFRIINNTLYTDWPWGYDRFTHINTEVLLNSRFVLTRVRNLPDSAFFYGEEVAYLPSNFPFPAFSESPTINSNDIPFPWSRPFEELQFEYRELHRKNKQRLEFAIEPTTTEQDYMSQVAPIYEYMNLDEPPDWDQKLPKAACYSSLTQARSVFYDIALKRPDIFDAKWIVSTVGVCPWNPSSREKCTPYDPNSPYYKQQPNESTIGYIETLLRSHVPHGVSVDEKKYKYLVVLLGKGSPNNPDGLATADRLLRFLRTSGAVVLLQESHFSYHFSSRLKPWVHYVPIAHNTADVAEKVDWLIAHDNLAKQIAKNGFNFARSYLRLEDHYCYLARAYDTIGQIMKGSDATEMFISDPISIEKRRVTPP